MLCSEEHDRRLTLLSQREQSAEIGIGRDENAAFIPGALENLAVCGCVQTVIAHMDGIMPIQLQLLRENRRQSIVHEELHGTVSGNSRSRTASAA